MLVCKSRSFFYVFEILSCIISASSVFSNEDMYFLNNDNFFDISNNLMIHYILTENINLIEKEWTPVGNETHPFSGRLDSNNYVIGNLTISKNIPGALFLNTDGAEFNDIVFNDLNIRGNPVAPLMITGKNTQVNGIKILGGTITGYNGYRGNTYFVGNGNNGAAASGIMHRGENVTLSNVLITLPLRSGSGGHGGSSSNNHGGNGGPVSSVMHTGIDSTISNVVVSASLQSGIGGQAGYIGTTLSSTT